MAERTADGPTDKGHRTRNQDLEPVQGLYKHRVFAWVLGEFLKCDHDMTNEFQIQSHDA